MAGMSDPFDLDHFLALPRLSGLRLSPDGAHLLIGVASLAPDGKKWRTALWRIDPVGAASARRLTRSAAGESSAAFLPDGSIVFSSARPDPEGKPDGGDPPAGLWHMPADGGEARLLLAPPGGIGGLAVARDAGTLLLLAPLHPDAADFADDARREVARKDAGVSALLFEDYPIRYWDHYLGPRDARFFTVDQPGADGPLAAPVDLTGSSGTALPEPHFAISPDGSRVATTWRRTVVGAAGDDLVLIDRAGGGRRTLTDGHGWYSDPAFSPDGDQLAAIRASDGTPTSAMTQHLVVFDLDSGAERVASVGLDRWPMAPQWSPDGRSIVFSADDNGGVSIFRLDVATDAVTRLAGGAQFSDICLSPDGATIYALRAHPDRPPHVVKLDGYAADQIPAELPSPAIDEPALPRRGVVERLTARADDGVEVGSWLVRPVDAGPHRPAPLIVFVHGGPLGTWAGWSWRWNANLLVERGYAVLLPDPALSVGYGQSFIERGWGTWGERPYTDVLVAVDGALTRPDLDSERTALMGGSFGGYMANWVAGHTDRFKAIITHASLWELRGFHGTTDDGVWWEQEFGDPYLDASRYLEQSPHAAVANIKTPMLVIHGEKDARVPISEALRLWTDLWRHSVEAKFLYFPDENHWILQPQHTRIWYETVLAFLDQHVLGNEWQRPALL